MRCAQHIGQISSCSFMSPSLGGSRIDEEMPAQKYESTHYKPPTDVEVWILSWPSLSLIKEGREEINDIITQFLRSTTENQMDAWMPIIIHTNDFWPG